METPSVNRIDSMCWNGTVFLPMNIAPHRPAVKADIQPIAERGWTTRPRPAMPRPELIEAAMTWAPGGSVGNR